MRQLSPLTEDRDVEDIVLSPRGILYYKKAEWHRSQMERIAVSELWEFAQQLSENSSSTLGLTQPSVDSFWSDALGQHFRAHVVIQPLVVRGPEITLRRIPQLKAHAFEDFGLRREEKDFLLRCILEGKNILVAGSTGAGKTTFLTTLLNHLPQKLRVLVLEDSPELTPPTPYSTKLLSRQNRFGFRHGASWTLDDLVFESLRMRPDRIVLGECRGSEAFGIVTALQTGHSGIMTSIHAGDSAEALLRFRQLAIQGGLKSDTPTDNLWEVVVHLHQNSEGLRRVHEILWIQENSRQRIV